jgi:hypothetical protein
MTSKIEDMSLRRSAVSRVGGGALNDQFKASELAEIEVWIRDQMGSDAPDVASWEILWTKKEFFYLEVNAKIGNDIYGSLCYGADPMTDVTQLERWSTISPSIQTILGLIDLKQIDVFDAKYPVLVRRDRPLDAWRIGPEKSDEKALSLLAFVDVTDVLNVLLRTWTAHRTEKAEFARERLCDITNFCLFVARSTRSP